MNVSEGRDASVLAALATAAGDAHHLLRRRLGVHLEDR